MRYACQLPNGGSAPATPGFNAVAPEWLFSYGAADAAPAIPAAESTLGSHPCVGLNPKSATASQGNKYIEWSEEWICPELLTVAI